MKKLISAVFACFLLFSFVACGGGTATSGSAAPSTAKTSSAAPSKQADSTPASGGTVGKKIGILIPGSPTDGGFSQQGAEQGKVLEDMGYTVSVVQAPDAETIKNEGEAMAAEGFAIVFGHGGQCSAPLAEISDIYPNTWFVTIGGSTVKDNLFPVLISFEETTYVAGVYAAHVSKTGKLAYTIGGDYPAYTKTTKAFEYGARSVNPDIEVMGAVLSAPDPTEGYETTMNQIKNGADFILANCNEGQLGAMKAVNESDGVYTMGALGNFTEQAPGKVVANLFCGYTAGYTQAVEACLGGNYVSEALVVTSANGGSSIEWDEAVTAGLDAEALTAAKQAYEDIKSGKIHVPTEFEMDMYDTLLP